MKINEVIDRILKVESMLADMVAKKQITVEKANLMYPILIDLMFKKETLDL